MNTLKYSYIEKIPLFELFILIILLFGLYTAVFFYFTPTLFLPFGIVAVVMPYVIIKSIHLVDLKIVTLLLLILVITLLGLFLSPQPVKYFSERFKGFIHLSYTLMSTYFIFLFFLRYNPTKVAQIFGTVFIILIIGSALEIYIPAFQSLSDSFRLKVFEQNIYVADLRDLRLFGSIRPRLFTKEPSHVAKFFVLSLMIWFTLTNNRKKYVWFIVSTMAALFFIKSPIVILSIPLAFVTEVFLFRKIKFFEELNIFWRKGRIRKSVVRLLLILILLIIVLFIGISTVLSARLEQIISGDDLSFLMRIFAPPLIGLEVIKTYPFFGIGITAKELLLDIITIVFKKFGFIVYDINAVTNVLWLYLIYYGFIGSILILYIFNKYLNLYKIRSKVFIFWALLIFSQTMGGFVSIRWWFVVYAIVLIAFHRDNTYPQNLGSF